MFLFNVRRKYNIYLAAAKITLLLCLFSCGHKGKDKVITEKGNLEIEKTKGAPALQDQILPVEAPFDFPNMKRPVFPEDTFIVEICDVNQKESKTGGNIQAAINEISKKGGGTVIVPKGKWYTGRIILKSNVNLHFTEGAEVYFSGEVEDYLPAVFTRFEGIEVMSLGACIYANGQDNIAVTGKGRLIGPAEGAIRERILTTQLIDDVVPLDKTVSERVFTGENEEWILPPMFISPINCTNVFIEGISLEHTAFWNIVPVYCDKVIIRGVTIYSVGIPRGDGIDIESSKNVLIEYSTISSGDDCFTLKSGRGSDGIRVNRPTENVVIRYCLAKEGHGGVTCGSETAGMIRNLFVSDCDFNETVVGIRFKTRRPRGGGGENLHYKNIRMDLKATAFKWDMLGSVGSVGDLANRLPEREVNQLTPVYRNISMENITVENCTHFIKIIGIPESPLTNLNIKNGTIHCNDLILAHDATNIRFYNLDITSSGNQIDMLDCQNVIFEKVKIKTTDEKLIFEVKGDKSDSILFKQCSPLKPVNWELGHWSK
jgi:polygalacturonase